MAEFEWPENCKDCAYYHQDHKDDEGLTWATFCDLFHGNGIDPNCDQKKPIINGGERKTMIFSVKYAKEMKAMNVESDTITLCGSVRLGKDIWDKVAQELALKGNLIFTVNVWGLYDYFHSLDGIFQKRVLDTAHKLKIEKSNRVVVLVKDGYIGESTRSEIAFAKELGISVEYFDVSSLSKGEKVK